MWKRRKNMKRHTVTGQLASRADLLAVGSKHCSLPHYNSSWRADGEQTLLPVTLQLAGASRLLAVASCDRLLSGRTIFHPKNPIFIQPNLKFDRELNLWWFYNLNINYTWIQWIFYTINNQFLPQNLIPKFAKTTTTC